MTLIPSDDFQPIEPADDDGPPAYLTPWLDRPIEQAPAVVLARRLRELILANLAVAELVDTLLTLCEAAADRLREGRPDLAASTLKAAEDMRAAALAQRPAARPRQ
jgi:hypothetical protein